MNIYFEIFFCICFFTYRLISFVKYEIVKIEYTIVKIVYAIIKIEYTIVKIVYAIIKIDYTIILFQPYQKSNKVEWVNF